ncbi:MAG TPA: hypothetical protein VK714_04810 [Myxococcota bacterium]|nr:hypothetical protein [Myxococcota bacterium]
MRASDTWARRRTAAAAVLALSLFLGAGCSRPDAAVVIGPLSFSAGAVTHVPVLLAPDFIEGSLEVSLDGAPAAEEFARTSSGAAGDLAVTAGAAHLIVAHAQFLRGGNRVTFADSRRFTVPTAAPPLLSSAPASGASDVSRTAWLRLDFASAVPPASLESFQLACSAAGKRPELHATLVSFIGPSELVVNPVGQMPGGASCTLLWFGPSGTEFVAFRTATAGPPASVRYNRSDLGATAPFPDDFWTIPDSTSPTGLRLSLSVPAREAELQSTWRALIADTAPLDGFSPIGPIVVELSDAADPATLPQTPEESLDPLASVGLFDLTPSSPTRGKRVPFRAELREDVTGPGVASTSLLFFPSIPLTPGGRYGLVITQRAGVNAARPFEPSAFMAACLAPPVPGEPAQVTRVRALVDDVLSVVSSQAVPPIPRDDVALVLRFSVRTTSTIPNDLLAVRADVDAEPPPALAITSVENDPVHGSPTAAIVRGTFEAPDYRSGTAAAPGPNFVRDASGRPLRQRTRPVPFTLTLPRTTPARPVPVVMYQHGNPGNQDEVIASARSYLSAAGFAAIAFTDILNREVAPTGTSEERVLAQLGFTVEGLLANHRVPDAWAETHAEQIAFVKFIQSLGALDVAGATSPSGQPTADGVPDLDLSQPLTYVGISEGANFGPGLLPYVPEIKAAALIAGGARLVEATIHQQAALVLQTLPSLLAPKATPTDLWVGLSIFQTLFDVQDSHNHAEFLYRHPLNVAGTTRKASVLLVEGVHDSLVPNHATESLAWFLGPIPQLEPAAQPVAILAAAAGPIQGNIDAQTTAAFVQYVPTGVPGVPATPGCIVLSATNQSEGHYCAQSAAESIQLRVAFLQSALTGVPKIMNPLP